MTNLLLLTALSLGMFASAAAAQTASSTLKITSPAFANGASIPIKYACDGDKLNPALVFSGVPAGAKSLALVIDDPDVPKTLIPTGEFVHWLLWGISPTSQGSSQGAPTAATK